LNNSLANYHSGLLEEIELNLLDAEKKRIEDYTAVLETRRVDYYCSTRNKESWDSILERNHTIAEKVAESQNNLNFT